MTPAAIAASPGMGIPTDHIDPGRVEAALRAAYRGVQWRRGFFGSIWDRAISLVGAALASLFDWFARFSGPARVLPWAATVAGAALLVWGGYKAAGRLGLVPDIRRAPSGVAAQKVNWPAAAEEAISRGDLRSGARALYQCLVQTLTSKGWIRDRPGLTAGECRRAVQQIPSVGPQVDRATRIFERVAYGDFEPALADIEAIREAEEAARAA